MSSVPPVTIRCDRTGSYGIRTAHPEDAEAVRNYVLDVLVPNENFVTQRDEYTATMADERKRIESHFQSPGCLMLLAVVDDQIVGLLVFTCGALRRISHSGSFHLTVSPHFRGRSIGTTLLQTLVAWGTANPVIRKIGLSVFETNARAIALYEQHGFICEGRRIQEVQLPDGRFIDDILMYRLVG